MKDHLTLAVDHLRKLNKEIQHLHKVEKNILPSRIWLEEFCTIQVSCARRMGKTTYIVNNLNPKLDLLIIPHPQSFRIYPQVWLNQIQWIHFNQVPQHQQRFSGMKGFKTIWFDEVQLHRYHRGTYEWRKMLLFLIYNCKRKIEEIIFLNTYLP